MQSEADLSASMEYDHILFADITESSTIVNNQVLAICRDTVLLTN